MAQPDKKPPVLINADDNKDHEFTLSKNMAVLVRLKNENITRNTQRVTDITSALVDLKWMNRREIYPWRVKEEVYGAVLEEILSGQPKLKEQILKRLEGHYQRLKEHETETLSITRGLAEKTWKSSTL
ncbi:cytoplasmic protein [Cedecea davisae]|uniref:Cytoplasmic protein n=1 Tax=Cedecea davisae TaxID=158484 RepID=A0ABS6DKM9_9ENTR|nr:cytoplasmic protein [Cedecea davisae]MBU4683781.1 cytoplasmic protein [Cedecea davisae]MBU4687034.1 cytoplasmic protein [Cedecea davisae]